MKYILLKQKYTMKHYIAPFCLQVNYLYHI